MCILLFHIDVFKLNSIMACGRPVPFTDEKMVFCALEPGLLDRFLEEYRRRDIPPVALKAVMTSYNAGWTPGRLCMELKKEHMSFQN